MFDTRFYLILYMCIGILIIGFELFYRLLIETYKIYIRICPNVFYIEFKEMNKIHSLNWFENKINNLIEIFYFINGQCFNKELKFNFNPIFLYLRYVWLGVVGVYCCFIFTRVIIKINNK